MTTNANKPVKQFRINGVSAAIWKREKDGKTFYSVSLERSYRNQEGEWKRTNTFSQEELAVVLRLAAKAEAHIDELTAV